MTSRLNLLIILFMILSQPSIAQEEEMVCTIIKSKSSHTGKICDAYKQLKEFWEYKQFVDGYIKDVEEKKEPRKTPIKLTGGKTMTESMNGCLTKLNEVVIPVDFSIKYFDEYPSLDKLTNADPFTQSKAMEAAVLHLQEASEQYKNYKQLREDLENFKEEVKNVKKATNILRDAFFEIMQNTGNGFTEFSSVFGFAALDIVNHISPLLASILSELDDKIKAIDNLLATKGTAFRNLHYNTQHFLSAEKETLNKELFVADSLNKIRQEEGERMVEDYNKMSQESRQDANNKIDEEYKRLMAENKSVKEAQDNLTQMIDKVERIEKNYKNLNFTSCPNGKTYNECDHTEIKSTYDADKKYMKKRIATLRNEIKIKLPTVNAKTTQYNKDYDAYKTLKSRLLKAIEDKEKTEEKKIYDFKKEHNKVKEKVYWIKQYISFNDSNYIIYKKIAFE